MKDSILTFQQISQFLEAAKNRAERSHHVETMLILNCRSSSRKTLPILLPSSAEKQAAYFTQLGSTLEQNMFGVEEAVLVVNPISVVPINSKYKTPSMDFRDSEGDAIVIVGRNAAKTQTTSLLQPFVYSQNEIPFWGKIDLDTDSWFPEEKEYCMELLDCLFVKAEAVALR